MGAKPNLIVRWELITLAERGILEDDEVLHEIEDVMLSERSGALVVTDRRVSFVRTSWPPRRVFIESLPLSRIEAAKAFEDPVWVKRWGSLTITVRDDSDRKTLRFDRIRGGRERAQHIADTIVRRQEDAERPAKPPTQVSDEHTTAEADSDVARRLRISVGRGVGGYVRAHGGRLYVWGEPVGSLQWMKAATVAPDGIEFVIHGGITDFELYIAEGLRSSRRLRLVRRWWLPGGGITVDTGLVLGG